MQALIPARLQRDRFNEGITNPSLAAAVKAAVSVSRRMLNNEERNTDVSMLDVEVGIFNPYKAIVETCPCSSVVNALGRLVQWSMTCLRSRVQSSVRMHPPSTRELFQIIPMHMMNREIIPGGKKKVQQCFL